MFGSLARAPFWKSMGTKPVLARAGAMLKPRTRLLRVETFIRRLKPREVSSDAASVGHLIAALEAAGKYDIYWSNEHFYCWLNAIPLAYTAMRPITTMDRRFTIRIDDAAGISEKLA